MPSTRFEAGNDTAPLETAPEGSRLGVFEPASDSVHAAGKVLFAQDAAAEQRIGQRQKLSFRIRRAAVYGSAEPVLDMAPFDRGQGAAGRQALEDRVEADLPGRIGVGDAVTRRSMQAPPSSSHVPPSSCIASSSGIGESSAPEASEAAGSAPGFPLMGRIPVRGAR